MLKINSETVVSPKETLYLTCALVIAICGWIALTLLTVGIIWIFLGIIAIFVWLANGLLVARLKADAVSVHPQQLGRLDAALRKACETLQQKHIPELYIIQSGGLLNAFATRHSGRHFVVIYSDMLEALGPDSPEMVFLLGHEIGHIKRNHLLWRLLLAPALFLPLLGAAYSRACESTCDRFGALACGDALSSQRAMMTLAGGKEAGKGMNPEHFADQNLSMRGFFVSWYELISGYPTLCRRVRDLSELETGKQHPSPPRNPLAYLFALFSFGGGFGGRGSFITTLFCFYFVVIFGMMAIQKTEAQGKYRKSQEYQEQLERRQSEIDSDLHNAMEDIEKEAQRLRNKTKKNN